MVDVADLPAIGAATNAQVMVALHDYTCHHCREMHPILTAAQDKFHDQLVIVTLPMPFDPNCNPLIRQHNPKHPNACAYAKLSLAVWRADRSKFHAYDDFLFEGVEAPPGPQAIEFAQNLIGHEALRNALADSWVARQLQLSIGLYEIAYRAGQGQMPQFIIGQNVAVGTFPSQDLLDLLARNLGLISHPSPP